jgi:hypothetical protein
MMSALQAKQAKRKRSSTSAPSGMSPEKKKQDIGGHCKEEIPVLLRNKGPVVIKTPLGTPQGSDNKRVWAVVTSVGVDSTSGNTQIDRLELQKIGKKQFGVHHSLRQYKGASYFTYVKIAYFCTYYLLLLQNYWLKMQLILLFHLNQVR